MKTLSADIMIIEDGKVLMVQQRKQLAYAQWSFPGGRVEAGESPEQAVKRETLEEVGLNLHDVELINRFSLGEPGAEFELYTYSGRFEGKIELNDDELMAYGWFSLDSLIEMKQRLRHPLYIDLFSKALTEFRPL